MLLCTKFVLHTKPFVFIDSQTFLLHLNLIRSMACIFVSRALIQQQGLIEQLSLKLAQVSAQDKIRLSWKNSFVPFLYSCDGITLA